MGPVDIDEYKNLAERIAYLLRQLCQVTTGTIFYYPMKAIDPAIYGKADTFRDEIKKLRKAIEELEEHMA